MCACVFNSLYFREDYEIKAAQGARNAAYLSSLLQLHTDLPYYDYKPGVGHIFSDLFMAPVYYHKGITGEPQRNFGIPA